MNKLNTKNFAILKQLTLLTLFFFLAILFWGLLRGMDFSDEGFLILGAQKSQETFIGLNNFHAIFKLLFFWIEPTLLNLRILNIFLAIISSVVFYNGFKSFLNQETKFFSFFIILISTIIPLSHTVGVLSYNTFSAYLLLMALGCFLLDISNPLKKIYSVKIFSGLFFSLAILVKTPNIILLIFVIVIYATLIRKETFIKKLNSFFFYLLGFIIGITLFLLKYGPVEELYNSIISEFSILNSLKGGHDTNSILRGILILLMQSFKISLGTTALLIVYFLIKKIKLKQTKDIILIIFKISFVFYFLRFFSPENRDASPYFVLTINAIIYVLLNKLFIKEKICFERKTFSVLTILLLAPFLSALGTNNLLIANAIFLLPCWMALWIYMINRFNVKLKNFYIFLFLSCSSYFFYQHYVINPYRKANLKSYFLALSSPYIKLDSPTFKNINVLKEKLNENGFKKGDPIITLFKQPGLIYLLEGVSPGIPLSAWDEKYIDIFIEKIKKSKTNYKKSYLLINTNLNKNTINKLNSVGINYPEEYNLKGKFNFSNKYNKTCTVKLYVHTGKMNEF